MNKMKKSTISSQDEKRPRKPLSTNTILDHYQVQLRRKFRLIVNPL